MAMPATEMTNQELTMATPAALTNPARRLEEQQTKPNVSQ
jgi:hypothetical protein